MPRIADGALLADFPPPAVDAILATATPGAGSPLASIKVRDLGGALARRSAVDGALTSLEARFAVSAVGMAASPELVPPVGRSLDLLLDALAPWAERTRYPNFADRGADASDLYSAGTLDHVRRIRAAHDPGGVIRSKHPIMP